MFERFTDRARRVISLSQSIARQMRHPHIGTEHILIALLFNDTGAGPVGGVARQALDSLQIEFDPVWRYVQALNEPNQLTAVINPHLPFTREARAALEQALRQALLLQHNYIGPEHLLLGMIETEDATAVKVLANWQVTPQLMRGCLLRFLLRRDAAHRPPATSRRTSLFWLQPLETPEDEAQARIRIAALGVAITETKREARRDLRDLRRIRRQLRDEVANFRSQHD